MSKYRQGDGLVIFELKSFTGRMHPSRASAGGSVASAGVAARARGGGVSSSRLNPTPGELEWFEGLSAGYGFGCRWLGRCWLDGQMAHKPEIARYYAQRTTVRTARVSRSAGRRRR